MENFIGKFNDYSKIKLHCQKTIFSILLYWFSKTNENFLVIYLWQNGCHSI